MTTIKASCPACGDVELDSGRTVLMVCPTDPAASFFTFDCPSCGDRVNRAAPMAVVQVRHFTPPPVSTLPALTEDDLIDFGLQMGRERA